jgi:hypothetical protein
MEVFKSKIGTNKKVAGSRIWIEGKRLVAAGFTPGTLYHRSWLPVGDQIVIEMVPVEADDVTAQRPYKVAGKGDKPIIDITGQQVVEAFCGFTHVEVSYLTPAEALKLLGFERTCIRIVGCFSDAVEAVMFRNTLGIK